MVLGFIPNGPSEPSGHHPPGGRSCPIWAASSRQRQRCASRCSASAKPRTAP